MITVLLGGVRSGKSALAVELARRWAGDVTVVATATPFDDDMAARIERHRADRPAWTTIEEPRDLAGALRRASGMAIVDCLTLWVNNLLHEGCPPADVEARTTEAVAAAAGRPAPTVVVSNEVGLGVIPPTELGRTYQDLLGRVNQTWVAAADRALLLVAGRAVALTDPWELLR